MLWILAGIALAALAVGLLGPLHHPRCPECHEPAQREIRAGIPSWVCASEAHVDEDGEHYAIGVGLASELVGPVLPFDGHIYAVPRGQEAYLRALWAWWRQTGCKECREAGE